MARSFDSLGSWREVLCGSGWGVVLGDAAREESEASLAATLRSTLTFILRALGSHPGFGAEEPYEQICIF